MQSILQCKSLVYSKMLKTSSKLRIAYAHEHTYINFLCDINAHQHTINFYVNIHSFELLKKNAYVGYFLSDVQVFAREGLEALSFLKSRDYTHTDLKPENILLEFDYAQSEAPPRYIRKRVRVESF